MPELSRWRAVPYPLDKNKWIVLPERGAPTEHLFENHRSAQQYADDLNRAEQYAQIGVKLP